MPSLMKTENWNGYEIRFVWHEGEWWAVAKDVANALDYRDAYNLIRIVDSTDKDTHIVSTPGGNQEVLIISEFGIYDAVFNSRKKEAKEFKRWVFNIIKSLREASGLEGFQIFRMLDKEHQKEVMKRLKEGLKQPVRVDFIKANTIANKAVSSIFGYPKMIKKDAMTPDMLVKRQNILEDTVELMSFKEKYRLDISVSKAIYNKYRGI
jgi:BRO family, N-terminal domain.